MDVSGRTHAARAISSRHNALVAACRRLARERPTGPGDVLLDGAHLIEEALTAGVPIRTVAVSRAVRARSDVTALLQRLQRAGADVIDVTEDVLRAMSPTRTPSGLVAIADVPEASWEDALSRTPPLVFVLVDLQDPGNTGAVIRSADAAGASGVICCGATAEPLGWKALRGSMGSVFHLPVVRRARAEDAIRTARAAGLTVVATAPAGGRDLFAVDLARPLAVVVGGEGAGLPAEIVATADEVVTVPMAGGAESLNAAVAAAVVAYEALRQRRQLGRTNNG